MKAVKDLGGMVAWARASTWTIVALLAAGCAGGATLPRPGAGAPAGVPGFDSWQYPGDATMRGWRETSPYRWVGYYLPAPCHRDASWAGRRAELERQGWGIAVLYVGQQVFEGQPLENPGAEAILCSRTLLSAEQGRLDARDAVTRTVEEGFPAGSVIFLDVERMERVPAEMVEYYRAWVEAVLRDGRYVPGTYAHRVNAAELYSLAQAVYVAGGHAQSAPFWVAGGDGFSLRMPPSASGVPFADVWQGALDVDRTWGGETLRVDENVAERESPSAPGAR